MVAVTSNLTSSSGHLRPFDARRDLNAVADLVETCFADTLDSDGRRYIQQMHSAARNPHYLRLAAAVGEYTSLPLNGFVWEENGYLVGNLSLILFHLFGQRCYLIANVAVDQAYRRKGIARALTAAAMEQARLRGAASVWLHVREENDAAHNLYLSQGFRERARRSSWVSQSSRLFSLPASDEAARSGAKVVPARPDHRSKQNLWLKQIYPPEVTWHLPYNRMALRSDLWGKLYRLLTGAQVRSWSALRRGQLLGVLSWQPFLSHADHLWIAAPPEHEEEALLALLPYVRRAISPERRLAVDYPGGHAVRPFQESGFELHQTLIWMTVKLS